MNFFLWMLAGGFVGWVGYEFLGFNRQRGRNVSVLIGAAGGLFGGKLVAPMFLAAAADTAEFSSPALFIAVLVAGGLLTLGTLLPGR